MTAFYFRIDILILIYKLKCASRLGMFFSVQWINYIPFFRIDNMEYSRLEDSWIPVPRVTLYTAGHLHTAVPHCSHSRAPLFTQSCSHCSHSRAPGEQWARLCVFTLHGCVQAARLCRGSPVSSRPFKFVLYQFRNDKKSSVCVCNLHVVENESLVVKIMHLYNIVLNLNFSIVNCASFIIYGRLTMTDTTINCSQVPLCHDQRHHDFA